MNINDILCVINLLFEYLHLEEICNMLCINSSVLSLYRKGQINISLCILYRNINLNKNILKQLMKLERKTIRDIENRYKKTKSKKKIKYNIDC